MAWSLRIPKWVPVVALALCAALGATAGIHVAPSLAGGQLALSLVVGVLAGTLVLAGEIVDRRRRRQSSWLQPLGAMLLLMLAFEPRPGPSFGFAGATTFVIVGVGGIVALGVGARRKAGSAELDSSGSSSPQ
jgi:hypothetical protein